MQNWGRDWWKVRISEFTWGTKGGDLRCGLMKIWEGMVVGWRRIVVLAFDVVVMEDEDVDRRRCACDWCMMR